MEGYGVLMDEMIGQAILLLQQLATKILLQLIMREMKARSILCNIGHFDNEIQVDALKL